MDRTTLLIATSNSGKLREVRAILADLPFDLAGLDEYPGLPEPVENAETFEGNARIKALHYARHTGLLTLADDSGLEVDALGGAPGVHSARYAGVQRSDADNNAKLIAALRDVPMDKRAARFRCAVALADREAVLAVAEGTIEGLILDTPRGHNGFGYDPHFLVPQLGRTTAELPPAEKNAVSHRGRAFRAIRGRLPRAG